MVDTISRVRRIPTRELVSLGYTQIPIDEDLYSRAKEAMSTLLGFLASSSPEEDYSFCRKGEEKPDLGYIRRAEKTDRDDKNFFHFSLDFFINNREKWQVITFRDYAKDFLALEKFIKHLNTEVVNLCRALDEKEAAFFTGTSSVLKSVAGGNGVSRPYATSTLRGLKYSPKKGAVSHSHVDRSFLTLYFGGDEGDLIAETIQGDVNISPPAGFATVFFGVKVIPLSRGQLMPLRYRVDVPQGAKRTSLVYFVHSAQPIKNVEQILHSLTNGGR